jgi:hypothetical protein
MSDENSKSAPDAMSDQAPPVQPPPGTPWPNPNRTTDFDDKIPLGSENE